MLTRKHHEGMALLLHKERETLVTIGNESAVKGFDLAVLALSRWLEKDNTSFKYDTFITRIRGGLNK